MAQLRAELVLLHSSLTGFHKITNFPQTEDSGTRTGSSGACEAEAISPLIEQIRSHVRVAQFLHAGSICVQISFTGLAVYFVTHSCCMRPLLFSCGVSFMAWFPALSLTGGLQQPNLRYCLAPLALNPNLASLKSDLSWLLFI